MQRRWRRGSAWHASFEVYRKLVGCLLPSARRSGPLFLRRPNVRTRSADRVMTWRATRNLWAHSTASGKLEELWSTYDDVGFRREIVCRVLLTIGWLQHRGGHQLDFT